MLLEVMLAVAAPAYEMMAHPPLWALGNPVVARASLSIPDTLFLFVVALVVFGPKRLPEIGKQIGKLVFEFRRASNDFKLQIEEELRMSEQQEKQKALELQAAAAVATQPSLTATTVSAPISESSNELGTGSSPATDTAPATGGATEHPGLVIQPPSTGDPVEAQRPNRFRAEETAIAEPAEVQRTEAGLEQNLTTASPEESTTHHA